MSEEGLERLSPYAEQVASDAKERYKEKISIISGLDPFLGPLGTCTETVPSVEKQMIWFLTWCCKLVF